MNVLRVTLFHSPKFAFGVYEIMPLLFDFQDYLPIIKAEMNSGSVSKESESKYLIAWELHHKLNVLLNKASEDAFKIIEDSIEWVSDEILQQSGDGDDATKLPLTSLQEKLVTSLMMVCCNMVALDFCDINLIGHIAELSKRAAERGSL